MTNVRTTHINRRRAIAGLGATGLGLSLGTRTTLAARGMTTADHPLTGMWLALANPPRPEDPRFPAPGHFAADGSCNLGFLPAMIGMDDNLQFSSSTAGVWEPYDEQTGPFTAVQVLADVDGNLTGTATIDGHPRVGADGTTFTDDGSMVTITIRDVNGAIVMVVPPGITPRPVTAIRMRVGNAGFPGDEEATPTP